MKIQVIQQLNKIILFQIFFMFLGSGSLLSQNISIEKVNGIYKAVNLNIKNDSLNYIPAGTIKPELINDSIVAIFSYRCVPELSSSCSFGIYRYLFNDKKEKISYNSFNLTLSNPSYSLKAKKCFGKWVFKLYYSGKIYKIREKYDNNDKIFFKNICVKFNSFGIDGLKCN